MLEIFQYDFMVRAFVAGLVVGIIAPMTGIFLVVKRYSLLADTLAHVSLLGVTLSVMLGFNPVVGALAASIIAALGVERLRESSKIFGESVLALFLSGSLAIALVLLGLSHGLNINIFTYLFGSITTVSAADIWIIVIFGVITSITTILLFKRFFLISYDEELAKANGLPVPLLNAMLMILSAITVALAMRIVGILLVGALMIIPVLSAMQFGKSFKKTALLALVLSLLAVFVGLFASFYLNLPSGSAIVVVCLILFALSSIFNKQTA